MACLPITGGCERERIDPFIAHLNMMENQAFQHTLCLDRFFRTTPQPEALYTDTVSGAQLVIERKTLVWPLDAIQRHQNDHLLATTLVDRLDAMLAHAPFTLDLPAGLVGSRKELAAFAEQVSSEIVGRFARLRPGHWIGETNGPRSWRLSLEEANERNYWEPANGLIIRWEVPDHLMELARMPDELVIEVQRIYENVLRKFDKYEQHRRILLLEFQGELSYSTFWIPQLFERVPPPPELPEIWEASFDWVTDFEQEWMFERLHPRDTLVR